MESCFGTIETELVHQACYPIRDSAQHELFAYIEGYYNRQRLHSALGDIGPNKQRAKPLDPGSTKSASSARITTNVRNCWVRIPWAEG
jgi:transposase InsO family protein